jgi:Na+/proline symporter
MEIIVISAFALSFCIYLLIGVRQRKSVSTLGDIIPIVKGKNATVKGHSEFSASNVAASISLATVIVAFFDLVPSLGIWLLWPAITTALGFWLFSLLTKRIWQKMSLYNHRPSLHEFIGTEFNSKSVALTGAIFTTIGYLSAFAVELTVGGRFLSGLIPEIPQLLTVIIIALVGFIYTGMGGFRTVVVTDRIQMWFIWLLLGSLLLFYSYFGLSSNNGMTEAINIIPKNLRTISWSDGLIPFVIGIFIMNLFTYISNMGLWQRISGSQEPETVIQGMRKSVYQSALSWSLFAIVAVGAFMIVKPVEGENLLITLLNAMLNIPGGKLVIFCVTLGLYGAMLSTASTQLIAVSHTIYEDIIAPFRNIQLSNRINSKKELSISRWILIISAIVAVFVVELLRVGGFSVADLAFSIYGASLSLVPAILLSLFLNKNQLRKYTSWVNISVILGFVSAWSIAIYGKITGNQNFVFLAPVPGILLSSLVLFLVSIFKRQPKTT